MAKDVLLNVKNLNIVYKGERGTVHALNGVDIAVAPSETVGIVGETGAGKTTTAMGIMGLLPKHAATVKNGEILFDGEDILKLAPNRRRKLLGKDLAMVFQDPMTSLNPMMSVGEQLKEAVRINGKLSHKGAAIAAAELMESVGIGAERMGEYPHQFSGGMKQRMVIAMALAAKPRLLIADEPTSALDVTIQAQVLELIKDMQLKLGMAMLLITHDLGIVAKNCEKVAIMYAGQIVERGTVADIFDKPAHPYTKGLFASLPSVYKRVDMLTPIMGTVPDPAELPTGCAFHPRCPDCTRECLDGTPQERNISCSHSVRCFKA